MSSHTARRGGFYTSGKSGSYLIHEPESKQSFGHTFKQEHGVWPVRALDASGPVVAVFTKADAAISRTALIRVLVWAEEQVMRAEDTEPTYGPEFDAACELLTRFESTLVALG